jgi:hypothetical protein
MHHLISDAALNRESGDAAGNAKMIQSRSPDMRPSL